MRRALSPLPVLLWLLIGVAFADSKTDILINSLRKDSSFKVRAKAAEILAKRGDTAAISSLIESLKKDDNEIVRASAAAALGVLASGSGDADALKALNTATKEDTSSLVRGEAEKAIAKFPASPSVATPSTASGGYLVGDVYVELGKFTNTSKISDPDAVSKFQSLLDAQLASSGKRASAPPKGKKTITLDCSIQKLESKTASGSTNVTVGVSVTITRDKALLAVVSQEGAIELDGKVSAKQESSGRQAVLEALVPATYEDINKNLSKWK